MTLTPIADERGEHRVVIEAGIEYFIINLEIKNNAPQFKNSIADQTTYASQPWQFEVPSDTFEDIDDTEFTWEAKFDGLELDLSWLELIEVSNNPTLHSSSILPIYRGNRTIEIIIKDSYESSKNSTSFNLEILNNAPNSTSI